MLNETASILCAARNSIYHAMDCVEVYDITRDVRTFAGGTPIVAHPPCRAWSAFCRHQAKPTPGEKELAPLCVDWLRECGGVLEHPAHSTLYDVLDLPKPREPERGGLWSIAVNQSWWGDSRTKATWLLFSRVDRALEIPYRIYNPTGDRRRWQVMSKHQRSATIPSFAMWLVAVARSVHMETSHAH